MSSLSPATTKSARRVNGGENDGWREVTFEEIFDISSSKRVLQDQWKGAGVPFYRAREIVKLAQNGSVQNELFISEELYQEFKNKYGVPNPGDLMVSAVGTLGACYVVQPGDRFYFKDASVLRFSPKQTISSKFVQHAFRTDAILDQVHAGAGSTVGTYTISRANKTRLWLPPLMEQFRIAEILDKADALPVKRRGALAQLDALAQSIFLGMFGDPVRLEQGQLPTVRDAISQGALLEIQDGNHGEKHPKVDAFRETGIPFITADCLNDNQLNLTTCYFLPPTWLTRLRVGFSRAGDVLLSHKGSIGLTAIVPPRDDPLILSPQVTYYRPNPESLLPQFLRGYFQTYSFQANMKKEAEQTTRSYLGITRQLDLPLPVPSIDLQREFSRKVSAVEKLKVAQRTSLGQLAALVSSARIHAFRGEL